MLSYLSARLFRKSLLPVAASRSQSPPRFRPLLEEFEGRVVPAVNIYLGGSVASSTSWSLGRPPIVSSDDVVFSGAYSNDSVSIPLSMTGVSGFSSVQLVDNYTGTVTAIGSSGGTWNVGTLRVESGSLVGTGTFSTTIGSLEVTGGTLSGLGTAGLAVTTISMTGGSYVTGSWVNAGTTTIGGGLMTLSGALTTGALTLSGGTIDQPTSGTDITANGTFTWTGGTLNSTTNAATVNINGDGDITPTGAGTLSLGSSLQFTGTQPAPKETTINPGTLQLTNVGLSIIVKAYYSVKARVIADGDVVSITVPAVAGGDLIIESNGKLTLIGPGTYNTNLGFYNAGEFNLQGKVRAHLNGLGGGFTYQQLDAGAQLRIENGSTLFARAKVENGTIFLMMNPNLAENQQTATIHGYLAMAGGTILFSAPIGIGTNPLVYGTFTVNGDVNWTGGTYKPSVDYTTAGLANKWVVNGTMTSAAACVVEPNPQRGATPPAFSTWTVLDTQATAGVLPAVAVGSTLSLGQFNQGGRKEWRLAS